MSLFCAPSFRSLFIHVKDTHFQLSQHVRNVRKYIYYNAHKKKMQLLNRQQNKTFHTLTTLKPWSRKVSLTFDWLVFNVYFSMPAWRDHPHNLHSLLHKLLSLLLLKKTCLAPQIHTANMARVHFVQRDLRFFTFSQPSPTSCTGKNTVLGLSSAWCHNFGISDNVCFIKT